MIRTMMMRVIPMMK